MSSVKLWLYTGNLFRNGHFRTIASFSVKCRKTQRPMIFKMNEGKRPIWTSPMSFLKHVRKPINLGRTKRERLKSTPRLRLKKRSLKYAHCGLKQILKTFRD